jgi:hypothetical protein
LSWGWPESPHGAYFPPAPGWQYKNLVVRMGR